MNDQIQQEQTQQTSTAPVGQLKQIKALSNSYCFH